LVSENYLKICWKKYCQTGFKQIHLEHDTTMEYRILGRTGLVVSAFGIGTWQLSGPLSIEGKADGFPDIGKETAINLIKACREFGINFIDSAEIYGDGEGERRVGEAIKGMRDEWILCTKFGLRRGIAGERIRDARPNTIRKSLEGSLRRLRTDYIDVYLYHSPPDPTLINEGREVLETLKKEGKIRFYGISTNDYKVLNHLVELNSTDVVLFSQSLVTHPSDMLNLVEKKNLGGLVRGALESGRLSGKYFNQMPQFLEQDIRQHTLDPTSSKKYFIYGQFLEQGVSMTAFSLRYLLDFGTTNTIILGGKSVENYKDALKAFNLQPLDREQHISLDLIRQKEFSGSISSTILYRLKKIFREFRN
jgi:aryl-alcohol dehydrogenase-like predicted oxidoreductase